MATGIVMILSAILTTTAMTILALSGSNNARDMRYMHLHSAVAINQATLFAFGQNTHAWQATVAHNKSRLRMTCVNDPSPAVKCDPNIYEELDLRTANGTANGAPYYSYDDGARNGFGLDGAPCAFVKLKATNNCYLRLRLRWHAYCGNTPCKVWPEKVALQWVYDVPDRDHNNFNTSNPRFYLPIDLVPLEGELLNGNPHR